MICDTLGRPLRFMLTAGQRHDNLTAKALLEGFRAEAVLPDRAYDNNDLRQAIADILRQIPCSRPGNYDAREYGRPTPRRVNTLKYLAFCGPSALSVAPANCIADFLTTGKSEQSTWPRTTRFTIFHISRQFASARSSTRRSRRASANTRRRSRKSSPTSRRTVLRPCSARASCRVRLPHSC